MRRPQLREENWGNELLIESYGNSYPTLAIPRLFSHVALDTCPSPTHSPRTTWYMFFQRITSNRLQVTLTRCEWTPLHDANPVFPSCHVLQVAAALASGVDGMEMRPKETIVAAISLFALFLDVVLECVIDMTLAKI